MYAPENPALFQLFLEHAPTAVAMVDRDMRYLLTSRRWLTDWGLGDSDIRGRSHYQVFPLFQSQKQDRWREIHAKCLAGAVERWEEDYPEGNGATRVKWEVHPWTTQTGEIGGLILFAEGLTQASSHAMAAQARANELHLQRQSQVLVQLATSKTQKSGNLNASLREIGEAAADILEVERVSLWLLEKGQPLDSRPSRDRLSCIELFNRKEGRHSEGEELSALDYPTFLHALATERAIAATNVRSDPRTQEFSESYLTPHSITSILAVPIRIGGQLVGFLCCEHAVTPRKWQLGEQNFAASIGDCAALALETSDRAKVQAELLAAKDQLQAVLDAVPGCVSWFNKDLTYLGVNGYLADTFNLQPEEFIGKKIGFLHGSPEFNDLVPQFFANPVKEDRHEIEVLVRGEKQYFLVVAHKYLQGEAAVFVGFDITQRKQAEAALQQANEELEMRVESRTKDLRNAIAQLQDEIAQRKQIEEGRDVLEFSINQAADAVFWLTPDAHFFYVNDAACISLGYSREELIARSLPDINPDFPAEVWPDYWQEIKEFGFIRLESTHYTKDGKSFPVEITVNYFQVNGKEYNCIFARDITERKQVEAELYQTKASAEAASQAKSAFLANTSHALRTPLTSIVGYSQLLQEDARELGLGETDLIDDLQAINTAGKQLVALIENILDFSKMELHQSELHLESFNVAGLIREVQTNVQQLGDPNGNTLTVNCSLDIGTMHGDRAKVRQVLLNLLSHASKYTENGIVTLDVSREDTPDFRFLSSGFSQRDSSAESIEQWIVMRVRDNGVGMARDQLDTLFQETHEADVFPTRRYSATGLGLAISRSFCQMMGGDIIVESEVTEGSTFIVYLPVNVPDSFAESVAGEKKSTGGFQPNPVEAIPNESNAYALPDEEVWDDYEELTFGANLDDTEFE